MVVPNFYTTNLAVFCSKNYSTCRITVLYPDTKSACRHFSNIFRKIMKKSKIEDEHFVYSYQIQLLSNFKYSSLGSNPEIRL